MAKGEIGADLGEEHVLGMTYSDFRALENSLPEARFVDASKVFWKLRLEKIEAEIDCMRKVCDITSKAYEQFFESVKKGMSEIEISKMLRSLMTTGDATVGFVTVKIFPGAILGAEPSNRSLKDGDTLFMDMGASYKGYGCDFSRLGVVGKPPRGLKKMHKLVSEITWKCVEMVKPGIKASDIAKACTIELQKSKLREKPAGRIGHGLGLGGIEPPSICHFDDTVLNSGMIVTFEPEVSTVTLPKRVSCRLPEFRFVQEENVLVTKSGFEVLSWASRDLHII